jgi:DNA-binding MarR family transcriptional regulator
MNAQEIRTLKILEALDGHATPSQRDLAISLGISLGLVNAFIKRLARKGFFKVTHLPRNRIAYMLTPTGAAEKSRLTYEYIRHSLHFYKATRERIQGTYRALMETGARRVGFFGLSELTEIAYLLIQETPLSLVAVYDPQRAGEQFFQHRVGGWDALANRHFDRLLVTTIAFSVGEHAQLVDRGLDPATIICFM